VYFFKISIVKRSIFFKIATHIYLQIFQNGGRYGDFSCKYLANEKVWWRIIMIFIVRWCNPFKIGNKNFGCQCPLTNVHEAAPFTVRSTPHFRNTNWIEPKTVTLLFWLPLLKNRGSQNSHVTVRTVMWPLLVRFN
jgi:hypothetical protein